MSDSEELIHGVPANVWNETKVPGMIGTCVFFIVLILVTISLRFYARLSSAAPLWWDDWFALATVPFALLNPIYDLVQIDFGFGRHTIVWVTTKPEKVEGFYFNLYIILLFYNLGLAIFKYSFLALYIRLFSVSKSMRYACYAIGILITMWWVACVFAIAFRCNPVAGSWNNMIESTCIPLERLFLAQSIPTITFDIIIFFMPVRLIWNIQMARPAKIGVITVFFLGGIVTVISIVRLVVLLRQSSDDLPWDYIAIGLWSAAEPIAGLLCCCLPAYAPLLRRLVKRTNIGSWTTNSNSQKDSANKTKMSASVSAATTYPERASRSYWVGYKRSDKDSDQFELTSRSDGNVVKDGRHPELNDSLESAGWARDGIHITQEVDVQSHRK